MTTYRLMDGVAGRPGNGPSSPTSYSGAFLAGIVFGVTQGGMWLEGYWHWVPTGGDTVARKFCLWQMTSGTPTETLVPDSTVTSGTLTADAWNYIPLPAPVPVAIGTQYVAATGWESVSGFPDTANQFASGDPYVAGITNGPLVAWSDGTAGGTNNGPYPFPQGLFGTAGTDPTVNMPGTGSDSANFWVDVQVSDTAPYGYAGSCRLWPGKYDTNADTVADLAVNYNVGTEFRLAQPCTVNNIWYYSPSGTSQLATAAHIWTVTSGGLGGAIVAGTSSPSWSGAAGSGWVSCPVGQVIPAGDYRVAVWNDAASPDQWSAKDATTDYWRAGYGASGITSGPLYAPPLADASLAYNYNNNAGGTPPYSDGTTLQGQSVFGQSTSAGPEPVPWLFAPVDTPDAGSTQNYWVDVEVTPIPMDEPVSAAVSPAWRTVFGHRPHAVETGDVTPVNATIPGAVAAIAIAAPAGTVAASSTVAGATASLSLAAPAGTAGEAESVTGAVSALSLAAPAGSVSASSSVAGTPAALALAAPGAGSTFLAGATSALTLAAPAGGVYSSTRGANAVSHPGVTAGTMSSGQVTQRAAAAPSITGTQ